MNAQRITDVESFDLPGAVSDYVGALMSGDGDILAAYREALPDLLAAPAGSFEVVCRLTEQMTGRYPGLLEVHVEAMNRADRPRAAVAGAIALARRAANEGAWEEAGVLLDLAEVPRDPCPHPDFDPDLNPDLRRGSGPVASDIHYGLASLAQDAVRVGQIDWAMNALAMAEALAELSGQAGEIARVHGFMGGALLHLGRFAQAELAYRRALATFDVEGPWHDAADAQFGLAQALIEQGEITEALAFSRRAVDAYVEHDDPEVARAQRLIERFQPMAAEMDDLLAELHPEQPDTEPPSSNPLGESRPE